MKKKSYVCEICKKAHSQITITKKAFVFVCVRIPKKIPRLEKFATNVFLIIFQSVQASPYCNSKLL
ncbi:UNVERIFIED_CONTAM: hypothetical protein NCL1_63810 [Trichonephila clavipes]